MKKVASKPMACSLKRRGAAVILVVTQRVESVEWRAQTNAAKENVMLDAKSQIYRAIVCWFENSKEFPHYSLMPSGLPSLHPVQFCSSFRLHSASHVLKSNVRTIQHKK